MALLDGSPDMCVRGLVLDLDKFAVHDGPGIRTTVYLKGCPLRCQWCHSPESQDRRPELLFLERKCTGCALCVDACPERAIQMIARPKDDEVVPPSRGAEVAAVDWSRCTDCGACAEVCYPGALKLAGQWMTVGDLVAEVEKDRPFFEASGGGVTLSGGELAFQPAFSWHFLGACRERGIHSAVETTGYAPWRVLAALADVADLFLYDLKPMDHAAHRRTTGVSNRLVHENLARLAERGAEIVVRVPCIPSLTDTEENVAACAAFVAGLGLRRIHLLPYNAAAGAKYLWIGRPYGLTDLIPQDPERMEALAAICRARGLETQIGG